MQDFEDAQRIVTRFTKEQQLWRKLPIMIQRIRLISGFATGFPQRCGQKAHAMRQHAGFTLIELTVIVVALLVLSAVSLIMYGDVMESGDATLVDSVQASLQSVVSQASARLDVNPTATPAANIVNVLRMEVPQRAVVNATGTTTYRLTMTHSGRRAAYRVNANGSISLTGLSGFTHYGIDADGSIKKL